MAPGRKGRDYKSLKPSSSSVYDPSSDDEMHPMDVGSTFEGQNQHYCRCSLLSGLAGAALGVALVSALLASGTTVGDALRKLTCGETDVCESVACVHLASSLLNNMNQSVDPCNDFFEYSCGGWVDKNPIPDDKVRYSTFTQMRDTAQKVLKTELERAIAAGSSNKAVRFYKSCMDQGGISQAGSTPLMRMLASQQFTPPLHSVDLGGTGLDSTSWEALARSLAALHRHEVSALFTLRLGPDDRNSSVTSVFITQNGLSLPSRDYYIGRNLSSDRDLQLLRDHISRGLTLTMSKATQSLSGFSQQIMERSYAVIRFEAQLAASMLSNVNLRNSEVTYNVVDRVALARVAPSFPWTTYFDSLFSGQPPALEYAATAFEPYPGAAGSSDTVQGSIQLREGSSPGEIVMTWELSGVDDGCPTGTGNVCGIHIHEGTDCTDSSTIGGHLFGLTSPSINIDPWSIVRYSSVGGISSEQTGVIVAAGLPLTAFVGRTIVVHDSSGSGNRIACGVITARSTASTASQEGRSGHRVRNVIVSSPDYLRHMVETIQTSRTQTVADYLRWQVVRMSLPHLASPFIDEARHFLQALYGTDAAPPRWDTCVSRTDRAAGFLLSKLYVDAVFSASAKNSAEVMISGIETAFADGLNNLSWMDDTTRRLSREKAGAVRRKIGFPDFIQNRTALDLYYQSMPVREDGSEYFDNVLAASASSSARNLAKLGLPTDRSEWHMTASTVNAYYNPSANEIVFPAAILQPSFYHADYLQAANYGGIGVVIGHELTHGFDDQGSQYDKHGNLMSWWSADVRAAFEEKTRCIANEYSEFTVNGEHENGNLTLGENMADNGGLRIAYAAYEKYLQSEKDGSEEPRLPGLDLTARQLFFVSFASVWCGARRPAAAHQQLLTDPHSPGRYRVIGAVVNSLDFAEEFGCAVGTPMNPEDKCRVW